MIEAMGFKNFRCSCKCRIDVLVSPWWSGKCHYMIIWSQRRSRTTNGNEPNSFKSLLFVVLGLTDYNCRLELHLLISNIWNSFNTKAYYHQNSNPNRTIGSDRRDGAAAFAIICSGIMGLCITAFMKDWRTIDRIQKSLKLGQISYSIAYFVGLLSHRNSPYEGVHDKPPNQLTEDWTNNGSIQQNAEVLFLHVWSVSQEREEELSAEVQVLQAQAERLRSELSRVSEESRMSRDEYNFDMEDLRKEADKWRRMADRANLELSYIKTQRHEDTALRETFAALHLTTGNESQTEEDIVQAPHEAIRRFEVDGTKGKKIGFFFWYFAFVVYARIAYADTRCQMVHEACREFVRNWGPRIWCIPNSHTLMARVVPVSRLHDQLTVLLHSRIDEFEAALQDAAGPLEEEHLREAFVTETTMVCREISTLRGVLEGHPQGGDGMGGSPFVHKPALAARSRTNAIVIGKDGENAVWQGSPGYLFPDELVERIENEELKEAGNVAMTEGPGGGALNQGDALWRAFLQRCDPSFHIPTVPRGVSLERLLGLIEAVFKAKFQQVRWSFLQCMFLSWLLVDKIIAWRIVYASLLICIYRGAVRHTNRRPFDSSLHHPRSSMSQCNHE